MTIVLRQANQLLEQGYPPQTELRKFPFANFLEKLWIHDEGYQEHGPAVLEAMNYLLSEQPERILKGDCSDKQIQNLRSVRTEILFQIFQDWNFDNLKALFRLAALYHDIGKYIIKDRHPSLGWHIVQHIDPAQKEALRQLLLNEDDYFQLLMVIIRDHDQFGVIATGEASYPILLRAARSMGDELVTRKQVISALMLFNLADMAGGIFDVDGEAVDKIIDDWRWTLKALTDCSQTKRRLDDYMITEASRVGHTYKRVQRLLAESSRNWPARRRELNDLQFVRGQFYAVFGSETAIQEFATQFTRICKLDYGKRFFVALMKYCEGPSGSNEKSTLPTAPERMSREDVFYAVVAILKRITTSYSAMLGPDSGSSTLIGVELKDLTPRDAPEKTARIIELIVKSHYPGLTWMISDVPAWYF